MPCRPCPRGFVLWLVLSLEVTSSRLCLSCGRRRQRPGQHLACPLLPVSLPACWGPRHDPRHLIPTTRPGLGGHAGGHSSTVPVASGGRAVWRKPAAEGRCRGTPPTRGTSVVTTVGTDGGRWRGLSRWGCLGAGPRRSPLPCPALPCQGAGPGGCPCGLELGLWVSEASVATGLLCPQTSSSPRSVGSSFVFVFVRARLCPRLGCIGSAFFLSGGPAPAPGHLCRCGQRPRGPRVVCAPLGTRQHVPLPGSPTPTLPCWVCNGR